MTCDDEHGDYAEIDPDDTKICTHCFLAMCSEFGPCDKVKCPCLCATRWSGG